MNIIIVGLNHKTAPVEIREKLSFSADTIGEPLKRVIANYGMNECLILSTCNRVEVVGVAKDIEKGVKELKRFFSEYHGISSGELAEHLYAYTEENAVKHLFRVASGLDSMCLGEPQILGQVKDAYGYAVSNSTAGVIVNKLLHKTFSTAKRIRTETKIGQSAVSISFAAVELAKKIFGNLRGKSVMLIGAGEMAELAARHLLTSGVSEITVANRTFERAVELAREFKGQAIMFREVTHYLKNVDIVIASTGAAAFIVKPDDVSSIMKERKHKPMFFIDISVPRNVDPLVNNIDNVYVYDIDDIQGVVAANLNERKKEAEEAEKIIEEEIEVFYRWVRSLDMVPTIIALRQSFERIRKGEVEKALGQLKNLTGEDKEVLEAMTASIVNKILHNPVTLLKKEADKVEGDSYIDAARKLFDLEKEEAIKKLKEKSEGDDRR